MLVHITSLVVRIAATILSPQSASLMLEQSVSTFKEGLTEALAAEDHQALLGRKLSVDALLTGGLLISELGSGLGTTAHAGPTGSLCTLLGFDYAPVRVALPPLPADFTEALQVIAPRPGSAVQFTMLTIGHASCPGDWPAAIAWDCGVEDGGGVMKSLWHQPCLTESRLDLPLSPADLTVAWSDDGAWIKSGDEAHSETYRHEQPALAARGDIYDFFSGLRAWHWSRQAPVVSEHSSLSDESAGFGAITTLTAFNASGEAVRRMECSRDEQGAPECIEIILQPVRVLRRTPESFTISSTVATPSPGLGGTPPDSDSLRSLESFIPTHPIQLLEGGARIRIELREASRGQGDLLPWSRDGKPSRVPSKMMIWCDDTLIQEVRYGSFRRMGAIPQQGVAADSIGSSPPTPRSLGSAPEADLGAVDAAIMASSAAPLAWALDAADSHCAALGLPSIYCLANAASALEACELSGAAPALHAMALYHMVRARSELSLSELASLEYGARRNAEMEQLLESAVAEELAGAVSSIEIVQLSGGG